MKIFSLTILPVALLLLAGCNQGKSKQEPSIPEDTVEHHKDSVAQVIVPEKPAAATGITDAMLLETSAKVLGAISRHDFKDLAKFFHPVRGVLFSPYAYVDSSRGQTLSAKELLTVAQKQTVLNWGEYDAREEPIKLNINKYFSRFVYDKNFVDSSEITINGFKGGGNSLNNLKEIYPKAIFVEYYIPGIDPRYGGMDWRLLRLVYQFENGKLWLIAIIHDEWTI